MKFIPAFLALLLAVPVIAQTGTRQSKTWINGHPVTIVTAITSQAPADCQAAIDQSMDEQGWHDQIYRSLEGNRAFLIYSQRDADACTMKEVKITLWRAVAGKDGKTVTESWVYRLKPSDVNRFLDQELHQVAQLFKTVPVKKS